MTDFFTGDYVPTGDRADWLAKRRGGLGGSDIAQVVGISPYGSPYKVWADKTGRLALDDQDARTEVMRWGQRLERTILDEWEERTGLHTIHRNGLFVSSEYPWAMATVDGLAVESPGSGLDGVLYPVEVKYDTRMGGWDEVPAHYECQAQWQMVVTGMDRCELVVLHVNRLATYTVMADARLQLALLEAGRSFWTDHVVADVPPAVSADDGDVLREVFPGAGSEVQIEADDDLVTTLAVLRTVKAQIKPLEEQRDLLEAKVKAAMGDAWAATDAGGRVLVTWKPGERKGYTVAPGVTRRLLLKEVE